MGSYAQALDYSEGLQHLERQQALAQNQDASLNIATALRTGKHPDTGAVLTPNDVIELTKQYNLLTAQSRDLFNPRQDVNKLGKSESAASGVPQPAGPLRSITDKLRLTKPRAGAPQTSDATAPGFTLPGPMSSTQTVPGGPKVTVQSAPKTPAQQLQDLQNITAKYRSLPGQQDAAAAQTRLQSKLNAIEADPKLTPEEKANARRLAFGVGEHPTLKLYTLPDGTKAWLDASRPDLIPEGATAAVTETADTRTRADFESFKKEHPEYKGTFEQWKTEQAGAGRNAAKPETLDKAYQDVLVKKAAGRPLSPDEKAHEAAWQIWNRETKIDPGVARAAAFGADRYIMVMDPDNPEVVIPMRAGDAAKAKVGSPQSIAFQTDKAVTKAFTTGKAADAINYFNTATDHLKLLRDAAMALNNDDTQAFNRFANSFATATGSPAPTNFDTVRNAVAGELAKTFKGSGASDTEIETITTTINNSQSPAQLYGAIDYDLKLMAGKMDALKGQYEAGKQGKPNFPSDVDDIIKALNKK